MLHRARFLALRARWPSLVLWPSPVRWPSQARLLLRRSLQCQRPQLRLCRQRPSFLPLRLLRPRRRLLRPLSLQLPGRGLALQCPSPALSLFRKRLLPSRAADSVPLAQHRALGLVVVVSRVAPVPARVRVHPARGTTPSRRARVCAPVGSRALVRGTTPSPLVRACLSRGSLVRATQAPAGLVLVGLVLALRPQAVRVQAHRVLVEYGPTRA